MLANKFKWGSEIKDDTMFIDLIKQYIFKKDYQLVWQR